MKTKTMLFIGCAMMLSMAALATPGGGFAFNVILSRGTIGANIDQKIKIGDDEHEWELELRTRGVSDFVVQDVALLPGGFTGWHRHPGVLLATVTEGWVEWYDENCQLHVYDTGDSFTESDAPHYVRNTGSVNARLMITYIVKTGLPRRIDAGAPACSAALGLN
jgi:quercetin dioxygenase-like cupin family protein